MARLVRRLRWAQIFPVTPILRWLLYRQDNDGDENWRLYLLDLADDHAPPRPVTPEYGAHGPVQAEVLAYHPLWHPQMLFTFNAEHPQPYDVYQLDLAAGLTTMIEPIPATSTTCRSCPGWPTPTCRSAAAGPPPPTAASCCTSATSPAGPVGH